jgi:hypothetical protein
MPLRLLALLLIALVTFAACSGPRDAGPAEPPPDDEGGPPAYETFDPGPYAAEPEPPDAEIDHDVPPVLMDGAVTVPDVEGPRTVQGYRVQVFSSADKAAADDVLDEATGWWRVVRDDPDAAAAFAHGFPAEVEYHQPYYRVRLDLALHDVREVRRGLAAVEHEGVDELEPAALAL